MQIALDADGVKGRTDVTCLLCAAVSAEQQGWNCQRSAGCLCTLIAQIVGLLSGYLKLECGVSSKQLDLQQEADLLPTCCRAPRLVSSKLHSEWFGKYAARAKVLDTNTF